MLQKVDFPDRHLDLGCGMCPHNPYGRSALYGVDVNPAPAAAALIHKTTNLAVGPIPFDDGFFGSVSAIDFLEHIPRVMAAPDGQGTVFPFVRLMDEIWRVLAPGGRLYAVTPCFPSPAAFQDPTHVNIISVTTHGYFCGENPQGRMYGFRGQFRALKTGWVVLKDCTVADRRSFSKTFRWWRRRLKGRLSHYLWELEAVK